MSDSSPEADRVDESVVSGSGDVAEEAVADSHASDVAAGFEDPEKAPVQPGAEEDGSL